MKNILLILFTSLIIALLIPSVSALGMERVEFFEVEQGSTQTIRIDVYTSPTETENEFTYEILSDMPEIHDWISVSPKSFVMAPGEQRQTISVTLAVPVNAELGDYNGDLKYAGSRVSGGGTIGYTVATKSILHFKVVKEGAKKKIDFITLDAKPHISPNTIAKFIATVKNTGNIPTNFYTSLIIEQNFEEVYTVDSAPMHMGVGLFEDVTLYWEPVETGEYTGHFKIIFDDSVDGVETTMLKSDTFVVIVSNQTTLVAPQAPNILDSFKDATVDPMMAMGIIFILIASVLIFLTFKPKKKSTNVNNINTSKDNKE